MRIQWLLQSVWANAFLFWHLWKLLHERQFQTEVWGKNVNVSGWTLTSGCKTRRGSTEREHRAALQEVTRSSISNIIHRNQITRGLFRLRDFYRFDLYVWITIKSYLWNQWKCSIYPTSKLTFSQLYVWLIILSMIWLISLWICVACFCINPIINPRCIISFSALFPLYLLVSVFCFSEKPFSVFCGADEPNKKLTHSSTNLHTAHLGKERECKDLGPNRATVAEHKGKARWVSVWNIWARRVQEGEGVKTKPACSPQANIVYIAVHANSMNILSHYFFALLV